MSSNQFKPEPTWQNIIVKIIQGEALQMLPQYPGVDGHHALEISKYPLLGLEKQWWQDQPQCHQEHACGGRMGNGEVLGKT